MFGIVNYSAFIIAGILLNLTPGPDTMYILGRSMSQGQRAGVLSALGIATGLLFHTLAAGFGLSVLLAQSAAAFNVVKYLGALYLIYLGGMALFSGGTKMQLPDGAKRQSSSRNLYLAGVLTNVLNPKVALFFLAFLPQFINPEYAGSALPFLILGLTFVFTGTTWSLVLAFFAAAIAAKLKKNSHIDVWFHRVTGGLFIYLGIRLALTKS